MRFILTIIFLSISSASFAWQKEDVNLPRKALAVIVKNLKEGDPLVKAYAIEALAKTGNKRIIPVIKKYVKDQNGYVKVAAGWALWKLGDEKGLEVLYSVIDEAPSQSPVNDPLVELKNIAENKVREKAIEKVTIILNKNSKELLIRLKNLDSYASIREVASMELAALGEKEELEAFYEGLLSPDEEIRLQTARSFSKICPKDSTKILDAIKKEKSSRVMMFLLESLRCDVKNNQSMQVLLSFCDDKNPTLRYKALAALSFYNDLQVIEKIKAIYADTPDANLKVEGMSFLLSKGLIKADYEEILQIFSYADNDTKKRLISLSGYLEKEKALLFLSSAMEDKDPYLAIDACVKLIKIASGDSI